MKKLLLVLASLAMIIGLCAGDKAQFASGSQI